MVTPASKLKRAKDPNTAAVQTNKVALQILQATGFARDRVEARAFNRELLPVEQDVAVRKITGIDPSWNILIENGDLLCMDEDKLRDLLGCLDLDVYLEMLVSVFETNWMNRAENAGDTSDVSTSDEEVALAEAA